jgi:hypothetical protein
MRFVLTIESDDDDLGRGDPTALGWLLGRTGQRIARGEMPAVLRDANGNTVGSVVYQAGNTTDAAPDGTEPWGELLAQLPQELAETDRFRVFLGSQPGSQVVHVMERGADDVYWPVGDFSARVTRAALTSSIAVAAYQATVDALAAQAAGA